MKKDFWYYIKQGKFYVKRAANWLLNWLLWLKERDFIESEKERFDALSAKKEAESKKVG